MANNPYGLTDDEMEQARKTAYLRNPSGGAGSPYSLASQYLSQDIAEQARLISENKAKAGGGGGNLASTQSSESSSSSFAGIQDEGIRALLKDLVNQMNTGGTAGQKEAKAAKDTSIAKIDSVMGDYSKQNAFQDAADLMALNLSKSLEANKPAIQRAVEGSGTSGGSMQALLSQKLAADSAQQAGALGAEQAKSYGQILAALTGQRGNLTTGVDQTFDPMMKLVDALKVSTSQSTSKSSGTGYFSPQQMNVETQADKLAQIEAQNTAAMARLQQQLGSQEDLAMPQASLGGGSSGGGGTGLPALNAAALGGGTTGGSLFDGYGTGSQTASSTGAAGSTTPSYMSITNTTNDNPYLGNSSGLYGDPYAGNYGYDEYSDINFFA